MSRFPRSGLALAAMFLVGGASGALGLSWMRSESFDRTSAGEGEPAVKTPLDRGQDTASNQDRAATDQAPLIDRQALRAALAELLVEERAMDGDSSDGELGDDGEGVSAADALMRLEQAYRAELASRAQVDAEAERLERARIEAEAALADRRPEEAAPVHAEEASEEAPTNAPYFVASVDQNTVGHAEGPGSSGTDFSAPARAADTSPRTSVHIDNVQVHHGDVNQVDARQTTTVVTQVTPILLHPGPATTAPVQPAPEPRMRSLPRPRSTHRESPWAPIDYSRHHNPWGPTFGRRP